MKMTPRQYARILGVMTETYANDTQMIVEKFVFLLRRNRHAAMFPKIAREFDALVEKRLGGETIRLQTASPLKRDVREKVEVMLSSAHGKKTTFVWGSDDRLTGGVRIQRGEYGRDESIARRLRSLRDHMSGRE